MMHKPDNTMEVKICLFLNRIFPRMNPSGRESAQSYFDMEYSVAERWLSLHAPYIDLKDKVVLDAGCGLGGKTIFYARNGCNKIIGIDIDENHINNATEFARNKGASNARFAVGSLDTLPFESNKFDIIFLNDVVEHIERPILINALRECKRVVKVNGRICIEFPPWTSPDASHLYDYIHTPWCHLIFTSDTLINVTTRMNPKRHGKSSVIEHFQQLNHITINEFEDIIRELDFKVINYKHHMIKNINILKRIPFFNRYLTLRVVAVLSKVGEENV